MKTTWVIQEYVNSTGDSTQKLISYLHSIDRLVVNFKYIPFNGTDFSFINGIKNPAVFFGTWNALKSIRDNLIKTPEPFVWCDWELFNCNCYYNKLQPFLLQQDAVFYKLNDIDKDWLYKNNEEMFFRPNDNEKSFTGKLVSKEHFDFWRKNLEDYSYLPKDILIVAAKPQKIHAEWRIVIVNGKAVASSLYRHSWGLNIQEGSSPEVLAFAEKVAATWSPHPVFIIDVGNTDNGLSVVEIGPFNYAGLYACNIKNIVDAIHELLEKN